MRRTLTLVTLVGFAVLATAGAAVAANGGFTPPTAHSPNADRINTAYLLIFAFTAAIFVLVEGLLVAFIWKYRSRGRARTVDGPQIHGHTRLELLWTAGPVVIVAIIAAFVFIKLPSITTVPKAAAGADQVNITVEGHQFYWLFRYPNGAVSIDNLRVPTGRPVYLSIVSADVAHSWWVPELAGKTDAIPGQTNHTWFQADRNGIYYGQCAEFCGIFHEGMRAAVTALPPADYERYVTTTAATNLGRDEFVGVCQKCHGPGGSGGYGPNLQQSPLLLQAAGLEAIVRNGRLRMPPVGNTWTDAQMQALVRYVKTHVYKGAATSGG